MYYNKDIFQKVGLDIENLFKIWVEVWVVVCKIKELGVVICGYILIWLIWIYIENFVVWNDMFWGSNENGLVGVLELVIDSLFYVKYFQEFVDLVKEGVFVYGGCIFEVKQNFILGECGILIESLGGLGDIVKFGINYGIGQLFYDEIVLNVL